MFARFASWFNADGRLALIYSTALAYGGLFWMHILHERRGVHELNEIAPALHWLRDASLAFPAVIVAVIVGSSLWRKYNERWLYPNLRKPMLAITLAVAATVVFILGVPLHAALFGGDHVDVSAYSAFNAHGHGVEAETGRNEAGSSLINLDGQNMPWATVSFLCLLIWRSRRSWFCCWDGPTRRKPIRLAGCGGNNRLFNLSGTTALHIDRRSPR